VKSNNLRLSYRRFSTLLSCNFRGWGTSDSFLRGAWTRFHQIWRGHRAIIEQAPAKIIPASHSEVSASVTYTVTASHFVTLLITGRVINRVLSNCYRQCDLANGFHARNTAADRGGNVTVSTEFHAS